MFGRRRASFTSMLLAPAPDDAPPAGGGGGGAPPELPKPPPPPGPPGAPAAGAPPAPPDLDFMKDPRVLAEIERRMGETDKRARAEEAARIREELAENARLEKLSVEDRARAEATAAKSAATKAENAAKEAQAENAFLRAINREGLVPHDDDCLAMAWQAAKRMAGDGQPVTGEVLGRLRTEKPHLFKGPSSPLAAAPAAAPGTNPAEVAAARTLSTTQPAAAAGPVAQPGPEDAFAMSDADWEATKKKLGMRTPSR